MAHAHHHHHQHGPATESRGASLLRASAPARLLIAVIAVAIVWAATFWAMAGIA